MMHALTDLLGYWLIKFLSFVFQKIPYRYGMKIGWGIGFVMYCLHKRRRVAYANLKAALGTEHTPAQMRTIIRRMYQNLGQMAVELFRFPLINESTLREYLSHEGKEYVVDAVAQGKGTLYLASHLINWELLSSYTALTGHPIKVLVRDQKHERMNALLNAFRAMHGNTVVPKGMALRSIMQGLRKNEMVAFAGDQSGGSDGVYVEFFGRETTTPPGAIAIAQKTGAVVIPAFIQYRKDRRYHAIMHPWLDIPNTGDKDADLKVGLRNYLSLLETYIRKNPDQWLWGHKRWKYTRDKSVVVLQDDKQGHRAQVDAVVSLLGSVAEEKGQRLTVKRCDVVYKSKIHRTLFTACAWVFAPIAQGRIGCMKLFLTPESYAALEGVWGDVVVSCGATTAPVNVVLRREMMAKNIAVMKPPFPYDRCAYDALFVPSHDYLAAEGEHVVRLKAALSTVNTEQAMADGAALKKELGIADESVLSVLVGGDTKEYHYDATQVRQTLTQLVQFAEKQGASILVTTSRRTRSDIVAIVKDTVATSLRCKLLVIPTEENRENIVSAMMGAATVVMVAEDSVSMISESVQSGKPVLVMKMAAGGMHKKWARFQNNLVYDDLITLTTYEKVADDLTQAIEPHERKKTQDDDTDRVMQVLRTIL